MNHAADEPRRVELFVPGLCEPPGSAGCCDIAADNVLLEVIDSWPGLLALDVDLEQATATVLVSPGHDDDLSAALEALSDRGVAATVLPDPQPPA